MRYFEFPAWCSFGDGDYGDTVVTAELNDEEEKLLVSLASNPDVYNKGFSNCSELSKLYDKIMNIADEQITEELSSGDMWDDEDEDDSASCIYRIGIDFPLEFEPN